MTQLWQGETEKAIESFPISGERVPSEVVRMLARIKAEAARVNADLGLLAGEGVHPNDHVNMGQSSNDTFPSAVHLAALHAASNDLLPALDQLAGSLAAKSAELRDAVKT